MILLDTNLVSEAMKPAPDEAVRAWLDEQAAETLYLSSVMIAELLFVVATRHASAFLAAGIEVFDPWTDEH